jgi:xanthine dehydrogenase accessory factor
MYPSDKQVLDAICRWAKDGRRFILATVARTWGSAPRQAGSMMAISDTGQVQGSVSGGCIEQDLIERLPSGRSDASTPFVPRYGVTKEEAYRYGLSREAARACRTSEWQPHAT